MKDLLLDAPLRFSGHETFPVRLLWLKKAFDAVTKHGATWRTFQEQDAIVRFGVGRNMALSMRHWAVATGVLAETDDGFEPTAFGAALLSDDGFDPFLEQAATLWMLHAVLVSTPSAATTFFFAFNMLIQSGFDREALCDSLLRLAQGRSARATRETIKRDVEVFLRSYAPKRGEAAEDAAEPLFAELGLIRETRPGGQFEFARGAKPNLPDAVFAWALLRHWHRSHPNAPTLSAEQVTYDPGSPGRVFKLDEHSVIQRLTRLSAVTGGKVSWTDTAGLGQVALNASLDTLDPEKMIGAAYETRMAA